MGTQSRLGSSPHTRGAPAKNVDSLQLRRIIPAYAGSTVNTSRTRPGGPDHPRIRGEHGGRVLRHRRPLGSSPHTRGAHLEVAVDPIQLRIIPAYAGSTSTAGTTASRRSDHPRIRGEHQACEKINRKYGGSSPHTRGAPLLACADDRHIRIIPAYAGSTPPREVNTFIRLNHPRIRGEHTCRSSPLETPGGSSPHTRGAHAGLSRRRDAGRIIPAYAGSTAPA